MSAVDPGSAQAMADRIRDRRAAEGTLGKPQPVTQPLAPVSKGAAR